MKLDENNAIVFLDRTLDDFDKIRKFQEDHGFRLHSLSMSSPLTDSTKPEDFRYSAVMIRETKPWESETYTHLNVKEFDSKVNDMADKGFGAHLISATGPVGAQVYAIVFRKSGRFPIVRREMTAAAFTAFNTEQMDKKRILISADAFGKNVKASAKTTRYCGIWDNNDDRVAWNADALNLKGKARQQTFDAMVESGARPAFHTFTPTGGKMTVYVDSRTGSWRSHALFTRQQMRDQIDIEKGSGRFLVSVTASGTGDSARFSGIWDSVNTTQPRRFRKDGKTINPLAQPHPIDTAMRTFIDVQNLRGAALAIVHESRLVFAHGYSFAESSYPAVTAETLFRQASLSKTFTAIAIWRLMQLGVFKINKPLLELLPIKQSNGRDPVDDRFKLIRVQDLLESKSGIDQFSSGNALEAVRDSTAKQPASARVIENWIAEHQLIGEPGELASTYYGKTDYFLLGQIIAKHGGAPGYFASLKALVLDPLEMKRTRVLRSRRDEQTSDEALYHLSAHTRDKDGKIDARYLTISTSMVHNDRRFVPQQYGGLNLEILAAPGGISSAIVDMARLCAFLSQRDPDQPVLSPSKLNEMLRKAADATTAAANFELSSGVEISNHGYHGFDKLKVKATNAEGVITRFSTDKGGSLNGSRTKFITEDGKTWYIIAYNGNPGDPDKKDWFTPIKSAAAGVDWGNTDLFPSFGMSSFAAGAFS